MYSSKKNKNKNSVKKLKETLQGSRFRYLNEKLYTLKSQDALEYFRQHPEDFENYHSGFRQQVSLWPKNPVQLIIKKLSAKKESLQIADLGCGDAELKRMLPQHQVHSFDLVADEAKGVQAADICRVPLPDMFLDYVVFSLSLMNTNYGDALVEARRILKPKGHLIIAEVESRMREGPSLFINEVKSLGFRLEKQEDMRVFMLFEFVLKDAQCTKKLLPSAQVLKPCLYKKR